MHADLSNQFVKINPERQINCQNNNVTILKNGTIIVQPKPQQGKHIVKYQFTFVNDDDSDDESDDDDDDDNKNNHCGNDQFGGLSDTDLGASKY